MLNNSQFANRHNNRSQHQVAVPNRRQPGVYPKFQQVTSLALRFTSIAVEIITEQYVKSSEKTPSC